MTRAEYSMGPIPAARVRVPAMKANALFLLTLLAVGLAGCATPRSSSENSPPSADAKPVIQPNPKTDLKVDMTPGMIVVTRSAQRRNFFEALNLMKDEMKVEQARPKPRWVQVAYLKLSMGQMLGELGRYEEALEAFSAAQEIWLRRLGPEHDRVADSYVKVGAANKFLGRLAKAREHYHQALAIHLKLHGPMDKRVVGAFNEIGLLHFESGDFKKARVFHAGALALVMSAGSRKISTLAPLYHNLAQACAEAGDYAQARLVYEKILEAMEGANQLEHPSVGPLYLVMARDLARQPKPNFEEAHDLTDRAEALFLRANNPKLYPGYEHIVRGQIFHRQINYTKASEAFTQAAEVILGQKGGKDRLLGRVYYYHGLAKKGLGEDQQAREFLEKALAIQIKNPGPESYKTVETQAALAALNSKEQNSARD
jgi:tetratricopeptide (TPR) repeat protein